jgi:hypothetical protein
MAYQINALFDDGNLLMSDMVDDPTPALCDQIEFWRDGRPVIGTVRNTRSRRLVSLHAPTRSVDEVHFPELAEEFKDRSNGAFLRLWQFLKSVFADSGPR